MSGSGQLRQLWIASLCSTLLLLFGVPPLLVRAEPSIATFVWTNADLTGLVTSPGNWEGNQLPSPIATHITDFTAHDPSVGPIVFQDVASWRSIMITNSDDPPDVLVLNSDLEFAAQ